MSRPDIHWSVGISDEAYSTQVWIARVEGLRSHLRILRDHMPDGRLGDYLRKQAEAGIREADGYIADAVQSDCREEVA